MARGKKTESPLAGQFKMTEPEKDLMALFHMTFAEEISNIRDYKEQSQLAKKMGLPSVVGILKRLSKADTLQHRALDKFAAVSASKPLPQEEKQPGIRTPAHDAALCRCQ